MVCVICSLKIFLELCLSLHDLFIEGADNEDLPRKMRLGKQTDCSGHRTLSLERQVGAVTTSVP